MSNLPVTSSAKNDQFRSIWVKRQRVDRKVLDSLDMALQSTNPGTTDNFEDQYLRIGASRNQDILAAQSCASHRSYKISVTLIPLPRLS